MFYILSIFLSLGLFCSTKSLGQGYVIGSFSCRFQQKLISKLSMKDKATDNRFYAQLHFRSSIPT